MQTTFSTRSTEDAQDHSPIQHNWSVRGLHLDSLPVVDRWARMCHRTTISSSSSSLCSPLVCICSKAAGDNMQHRADSVTTVGLGGLYRRPPPFLCWVVTAGSSTFPSNSFHCAVFALLTDVWINKVTIDHVNKWSMAEHLELTRWGSCSNYIFYCMNAFSYDEKPC